MNIWQRIKQRFINRGPKYQPNFVKTPQGNGIAFGKELIVRVKGAEVVTGRIFDVKNHKTYQIDQSHKFDEDMDEETTNFTLKSRLHPQASQMNDFQMPKGDYMLLTWWWDNDTMRGGTYKDRFVIF